MVGEDLITAYAARRFIGDRGSVLFGLKYSADQRPAETGERLRPDVLEDFLLSFLCHPAPLRLLIVTNITKSVDRIGHYSNGESYAILLLITVFADLVP